MIQLGAVLSGFTLFALFTWLPIWGLATASSAEGLFRYFVVVLSLMFGVFMTSAGRSSFSFIKFMPALVAGGTMSLGYGNQTWWLMAAGFVVFAGSWIYFGE